MLRGGGGLHTTQLDGREMGVVRLIPTHPLTPPQAAAGQPGVLLEQPATAPFHSVPAKRAPSVTQHNVPRKVAVGGGLKGPLQRRAAALPSDSPMGRWSAPTTGAPSKATPRAVRWCPLWRSIEKVSGTQIFAHGLQNRTVFDRAHRSCSSTSGRRKHACFCHVPRHNTQSVGHHSS